MDQQDVPNRQIHQIVIKRTKNGKKPSKTTKKHQKTRFLQKTQKLRLGKIADPAGLQNGTLGKYFRAQLEFIIDKIRQKL